MKKNYKAITVFIVLLSMIAVNLSAQISGVVTINSASGTSGTNYQTFNALATVLNSGGVSGPLTVNVVANSGPYNEQVNFNQIAGASNVNTITINGNNNTITFGGDFTLPHTIKLSGTDFMHINNLNMVGTDMNYAHPLHLWNGANSNTFTACTFSVDPNGTGYEQVPVSLSGASNYATSSGSNAGDNNIWNTCNMIGGYFNVTFYTNTGLPYNFGNQLVNCNMKDYYYYGLYNYYAITTKVSGCTMERVNRTNAGWAYCMYMINTSNSLIENNKVWKQFDASPGTTNGMYGIYISGNSTLGFENIIRNNIFAMDKANSTFYGIYAASANYIKVYHNTVSINDVTNTAGTTRGIFASGGTTNREFRNNIVSITRGGSGTKYCLYYTGSGITSNNNNLYINSAAGTNNTGYYLGAFATLANWQTANANAWDQNSTGVDPVFANVPLNNFFPNSNTVNNTGAALGLTTDIFGNTRSLATPDPGAIEFFNNPCTNTPASNSVPTPSTPVCPGTVLNLGLANTYTTGGISYQWIYSTGSALGPFTVIPGANIPSYTTPSLTANVWYSVVLGCANGGTTVNATAGQIQVSNTTTNTAPYFEGFEGITSANQLPNCSWSMSNPAQCHTAISPNSFMTANTGSKYAYFGNTGSGVGTPQYFYSNGILLKAGVTYSGSIWYLTPGYATVSDLVIAYNTSQTSSGMTNIATISNPQASIYTALSNTFVVPATGMYYIVIKTTDNYSYNYFAWDDLAIDIPCQIAPNKANLSVSGPSVVCSGDFITLSASGADTYTWSTGSNSPLISGVNVNSTVYTALGTNLLSGCTTTVNKLVQANPLPSLNIVTNVNPPYCQGTTINMVAVGAPSFTWSTGSLAPLTVVNPMSTTSYTVVGKNAFNCVGQAVKTITVNPLPTISVTGNTAACIGDNITLTGGGANTYTWTSTSFFNIGSTIIISPSASTNFMVSGTDANGCVNSTNRVVSVEVCTGINNQSASAKNISVYPNPNNGAFTIELNNGLNKNVDVLDVTGRTVLSANTANDKINMNISQLANGVYYVKIKSNNTVEVIKVVKQ